MPPWHRPRSCPTIRAIPPNLHAAVTKAGARPGYILQQGQRLLEISGAATPPVERQAILQRGRSQRAARPAGAQTPSVESGLPELSKHFRKPWLTVSHNLPIGQASTRVELVHSKRNIVRPLRQLRRCAHAFTGRVQRRPYGNPSASRPLISTSSLP